MVWPRISGRAAIVVLVVIEPVRVAFDHAKTRNSPTGESAAERRAHRARQVIRGAIGPLPTPLHETGDHEQTRREPTRCATHDGEGQREWWESLTRSHEMRHLIPRSTWGHACAVRPKIRNLRASHPKGYERYGR